MSEKLKSGNFSLDTYISKQEGLLVEYLRKTLQAETKIVLLESALQEMYKKVEELNQQIELQQTTIDQSITGLQAVTLEKDQHAGKVKQLEEALNNCYTDRNDVRNHAITQDNRVIVLQNEIKQLNNKVQIANDDYSTLKENYNRVLAALDETNKKLEEATNTQEAVVATKQKKRPKKTQETESEWVDGEYKIST